MLEIFNFRDRKIREEECVFLLGGFDGFHSGHEKLLKKAREFPLPTGIMTIYGAKEGGSLFTLEEREYIFERLGFSFVLEEEFSEDFKNMRAEEFIKKLCAKFKIAAFVCGEDFRFGFKAEGTPEKIREITGIPVFEEDILFDSNGGKVGSKAIKCAVAAGNVEYASSVMTYPFFLEGEIIHGREMGRKIGFPTANMLYPKEKAMLKDGVYAVHSVMGGRKYIGIANYGSAPTFGVEQRLTEICFSDFDGNLYGEKIKVFFDSRLRDIKKFSSAEELKGQLALDMREAERRADI